MWGKCSPAVDKIKLDAQSPHDAQTLECLAESPYNFFKQDFDYCIHT